MNALQYSIMASTTKKAKFERFHGAFTGGFSAGYFNTVGSENNDGFQPTTFVSSRSNRHYFLWSSSQNDIMLMYPTNIRASGDRITSRKEYYMDQEDGLLGGHLSTKQVTVFTFS